MEAVGGMDCLVAVVRHYKGHDGGAVLQRIVFAARDEIPLPTCIQKLEADVIQLVAYSVDGPEIDH